MEQNGIGPIRGRDVSRVGKQAGSPTTDEPISFGTDSDLRAATSGPLKDASTTVRSRFTNLFSFGPRSATTSPSVSVSYFADASHEERANLAPELSPPGMVKTLANKITGTTAPQAILTKNLTEIFFCL